MTADINAPDIITLKIVSDPKNVSPLGEAINALCLYATNSEVYAHDIQLAVVEALNNVILHAYKSQKGNEIIVKWIQSTGCLNIEIIDYGISMTALPVAALPEIDAEGGRGWWIINACVDEYYYKAVEYVERERVCTPSSSDSDVFHNSLLKSSRNTLTLIKYFQQVA